MDDIKATSWFILVTWSYDVDLLDLAPGTVRYNAEGLGWLTILSNEDIRVGLIVEAEVPALAELMALDRIDQWLLSEDLPGLTTYETEVSNLASEMVELTAWSIITRTQDKIFLEEGLI